MAVFDEDIKELTDVEKPLSHNCQSYYTNANTNTKKTSTIKILEDSYNYFRIYYPISSFKSFYGLDIEFDPFNERKYCYFETEYQHIGTHCTFVRPFIVTLPPDSNTFDTVKDVEMLKGIAFTGVNKTEHLAGLKKICNLPDSFIEEANNGEIQMSRYIPKIDDMIEQIDADEIKEKLVDCYKIIFDDVDIDKVLRYERMIDNNMNNIIKRIIKPMLIKILCSSHSVFGNIFMKSSVDIEKQSECVKLNLEIQQKNLLLLDCIKSFHKFIDVYIDKEAFTNQKHHGKIGSLIPSHNLAMWELVKYIHSIFKDTYITLKSIDTQNYNQFKVNMMDTDSDNDLTEFFNLMVPSTLTCFSKKKKTERFIPSPCNDFQEFDDEMTHLQEEKLYIDVDKLTSIEKNLMLGHTHMPMNYEEYVKLLPQSNYQPLIMPTKHY
jgi:hypothetical protein